MDIFTTLVQTSKKLGISAFAYLRDRLSGSLEMPSLARSRTRERMREYGSANTYREKKPTEGTFPSVRLQ